MFVQNVFLRDDVLNNLVQLLTIATK